MCDPIEDLSHIVQWHRKMFQKGGGGRGEAGGGGEGRGDGGRGEEGEHQLPRPNLSPMRMGEVQYLTPSNCDLMQEPTVQQVHTKMQRAEPNKRGNFLRQVPAPGTSPSSYATVLPHSD